MLLNRKKQASTLTALGGETWHVWESSNLYRSCTHTHKSHTHRHSETHLTHDSSHRFFLQNQRTIVVGPRTRFECKHAMPAPPNTRQLETRD